MDAEMNMEVTSAPASEVGLLSNGAEAGGSGTGGINWERVKAAKIKFQESKMLLKAIPVDYATAVDLLDDVCSTLKAELGDLSIDTAEALFYYGSALVEQYKSGENLVGSKAKKAIDQYATELVVEAAKDLAVETVEDTETLPEKAAELKAVTEEVAEEENGDEDESDSEAEEEDDEDDAEVAGGDAEGSNQSDLQTLPGGATMENGTADVEKTPEVKQNGTSGGSNGNTEQSNQNENGDGDAIPELRYAWEILETARVGYEKRFNEGASHEEKLRLSEIHYKLCLCAAENGQQNLALVEAERSLKVAKEACSPTDRDLAEAYFNVGSIMSVYGMLSEAAENMKAAVSILENRKAQITSQIQSLGENEETKASVEQLNKEFKEIDELIPDLMDRIQDTYEDMKLGTEEAKQMLSDWLKGVSDQINVDAGIPVDASKPVNDISHLVRRVKRTTGDDDEIAKKLKSADGTAVAITNGTENGHSHDKASDNNVA